MTTSQDNILLAKQFGMIFTEYYSVVKYFAFMLLKSEEDAEDIAQDVFTKLWTSYQKHDPQFYQTQKDRISLSGESDRKKPY